MKRKILQIQQNADYFRTHLTQCRLCPRECGVNRKKGGRGFCGASDTLTIYTAFLHKGEEPPLSGEKGSGTIFFSGCNLKCIYCQNYIFSHTIKGKFFTSEELATLMFSLQEKGAHNINLVTPTHFLPQILEALLIALEKGLNIPIVYNFSGFEKEEVIRRLEGIIDIYLPDMKYITPKIAVLGSQTPQYPSFNQKAVLEMYRQKKTPFFHKNMLIDGLIIRHLVLPGCIDETKKVISWVKTHMPDVLMSIMFQYTPYYRANKHKNLKRRIIFEEYQEITQFIDEMGVYGWVQEFNPPKTLAGVHFKPF